MKVGDNVRVIIEGKIDEINQKVGRTTCWIRNKDNQLSLVENPSSMEVLDEEPRT